MSTSLKYILHIKYSSMHGSKDDRGIKKCDRQNNGKMEGQAKIEKAKFSNWI